MAGFVSLDTGEQRAERYITRLHGVSSHAQKLQVRESGFHGKGKLQCCGDRVVRSKYIIKKVTDGNHSPLVGVMALVRPVKPRIFLEQLVGKRELDLSVADFVQRPEQGHVTPSRSAPKPAHAGFADRSQVLGHSDRSVMRDNRSFPARVQVLKKFGAG